MVPSSARGRTVGAAPFATSPSICDLRWQRYCHLASVDCTTHQLRHRHATEMVNDGVSLGTIRKPMGHNSIQTTLLYAETSDRTADTENRAWRRRQERRR